MKTITLALTAATCLSTPPVFAQDIGVMSAVNREVLGERPRETARALFLNDQLIIDERVTTSPVGGGQVMFLDQTTLTLSPNSDIILDRYVFDPNTATGETTISMLKGAMRFVGGRITKTGVATIRTPTATIGIRGGIGHITVDEDGSTRYIHIAGQSATAENDAGSVTVTREGGSIFIPVDFTTTGGGFGTGDRDGGGDGGSGAATGAASGGTEGGGTARAGSTAGGATGEATAGSAGGAATGTGGGDGSTTVGGRPQAGQADESDIERQERLRADLRERIERLLEQRRIGALDDLGPLLGRFGGAPRFSGIATPEEVRVAIRTEGGVGDGGESRPVTRERVRDGVQRIETRISGADGATTRPPLSTSGERSETSFNEPPPDLGEAPISEIADANLAADIVNEINQIQDGLEFRGTWSAISGLNDGTFIAQTEGLQFDLQYSLGTDRGVVVVELPDAGDLADPNLTTLGGAAIRGDRFLVVGDGDQFLTGDSGGRSLLGGDATGTDIVISASDRADGLISIDYSGADLPNTAFVDGVIGSTQGVRVLSEPIDDRINQIRTEP